MKPITPAILVCVGITMHGHTSLRSSQAGVDVPASVYSFGCDADSSEVFTLLYVDARAMPGGKGTPDRPFNSVSSALKYAEQNILTDVELQLAAGVYREGRIHVTRNVRIVGPGSDAQPTAQLALALRHDRGRTLILRGLSFLNADGPHPAVSVESAAASTILCDVSFAAIEPHAIIQRGGTLTIEDVVIHDTLAAADDFVSGSAIVVASGAAAVIRHVTIRGSQGSGILATDVGTRVFVSHGRDNSARSHISGGSGCLGAVAAMNEALVLGEALDVEDNRIRGVAAFSGARAHFRNIVVRNTRDFEGGSAASVSLCGVGTASAGAFGGTLELSDFLLTNSDLVGFSVGTGGDATLSNGEVNDNPIGVFIEDGDFVDRIHCLERGVLFLRNDVNLDAPVLPLPCPISDPCPPPDPNVCAHVPFDPIWAT